MLTPDNLKIHMEQRIKERADLGHVYEATVDDDGQFGADMTESGSASIWRVVQDALDEAGYCIVEKRPEAGDE